MPNVTKVGSPLPVLANAIKDELMGKLHRREMQAVGRDQISAAIDARHLGLSDYEREDLISLVCRKIVMAAM